MDMTAAHYTYLLGIVVILGVMVARQNVVVPAVAATFLTAWAFSGSPAIGLTSIFNASLTAAVELFSIFLIIALMTALLGALRAMGADKRMVVPFQRAMRTGSVSFIVLFWVTYGLSLFFWPTPAVPLIGALLIPVAIRAGLPALGCAVAVAIAGQMALSSDYVIQVGPGLSAVAAGADTSVLADRALVLSLVTGLVAIVIAYIQLRPRMLSPNDSLLEAWESGVEEDVPVRVKREPLSAESSGGVLSAEGGNSLAVSAPGVAEASPLAQAANGAQDVGPGKRATAFAVIVPITFMAIVVYMVLGKVTEAVPETIGGQAAALVGGVAAMLLLFATLVCDGRKAMETCATHVVDGLVFAFKSMGVVIPIAGFFFIGNSDFAGRIMGLEEGEKAPGFLFELVSSAQNVLPDSPAVLAFGLLLIGMATGLDGSGYSGLPLTGSLSGALAPGTGMEVETLAAIGQMGAVWTGGGTLIAWSSLLVVAGFARVPILELVRHLLWPVVAGLIVSTIVAILLF